MSTNETNPYQGVDGKPVTLGAIFCDQELARVVEAAKQTRLMFDEPNAQLAPAHVYSEWLTALGLSDLADRARTELADRTIAGEQLAKLNEGTLGRGRAAG